MRLKDKVAIITGGSRGIGFATADKFLQEGATVILTASSQASADKAVAQLKEKYPERTVAGISPNLANLEDVRSIFKTVTGIYGCIVDFSQKTWNIREQQLLWEPNTPVVKDARMAEIFSFLKFGQPMAIKLADGSILASFWYAQEGQYRTVCMPVEL